MSCASTRICAARPRCRLIGPNCPGVLSPGKANVGIIPAAFFREGNVGVVSRSGTLTYQVGNELAQRGFGNSSIVGIGGDPVPGSSFVDIIAPLRGRPRDRADRDGRRDRRRRRGGGRRLHRRPRHQAGRRLHRRLHRPARARRWATPARSSRAPRAPRRPRPAALEARGVSVGTHADPGRRASPSNCCGGELNVAWSTAADSPSPAARRRWTSSTSRVCATPRSAPSPTTPAGMTAYGTAVGYVPLRRWIAERHGVDREPACSSPTARCRPTRSSSTSWSRRRRRWSSSGPATTARCSCCASTAPSCERSRSSPTASTRTRSSEALQRGARPKLAHIIPNFHNPAGYTLSGPKRERLLELAREHGFTIFEDDPYIALRFRGETLPTMLSLDAGAGNVVYASSFSKTVCPGIRVGYLVGPQELIGRIVVPGHQHLHLAEHGRRGDRLRVLHLGAIDRSIERVRVAPWSSASTRSPAALREQSPDASFVAPDGGYFLWVKLPTGSRRRRSSAAAEQGWRSSAATTSSSTAAPGRSGSPTRA